MPSGHLLPRRVGRDRTDAGGEALAATRGRSRTLAEGPVEEAAVEHIEGLLRGMRGEFDEGLREIRRCRGIFAEFGLRFIVVGTARDEALVARYAGRPAGGSAPSVPPVTS